MIKRKLLSTTFATIATIATAFAAALCALPAGAQTMLKFSHTDQPGGARKALPVK